MQQLIIKISIILSYYILGAYATTDMLRLTSYGSHNPDILFSSCNCPSCGHKLKGTDQIPVFSFLFHRGKCSYCGTDIPRSEFILESCILLTGSIVSILGRFSIASFLITVFLYETAKIITILVLKPRQSGFMKSYTISLLINIPIFLLIMILFLINSFIA